MARSRRSPPSAGKRPGWQIEPVGAQRARARMIRDLLMIAGAFALASAFAGALGAANLGTALAFGQIALAACVVYVMLRH